MLTISRLNVSSVGKMGFGQFATAVVSDSCYPPLIAPLLTHPPFWLQLNAIANLEVVGLQLVSIVERILMFSLVFFLKIESNWCLHNLATVEDSICWLIIRLAPHLFMAVNRG